MQILVQSALCSNVNSKLSRVPGLYVCVYIYIIYFISFLSLSLRDTGCGCVQEVSLEYLMESMVASNSHCASECYEGRYESLSLSKCLLSRLSSCKSKAGDGFSHHVETS